MEHGITLTQVYDAMRAGGAAPVTREGMQDALKATGLWDDGQPVRADIALSAYGQLDPAGSAESNMQRALEAVAQFIKPKVMRAELAAHAEAELSALRTRMRAICARASALGLSMAQAGRKLYVSLDDWETLLFLAEQGQEVQDELNAAARRS